jgi:polyphosphate kinase
MPRNFKRRIEIAFPVLEPQLQRRLKEILELQFADSAKAWRMEPDGSYARIRSDNGPPFRFQERFYEILVAEERARSSKAIGALDGEDLETAHRQRIT